MSTEEIKTIGSVSKDSILLFMCLNCSNSGPSDRSTRKGEFHSYLGQYDDVISKFCLWTVRPL